MSIRYLATLECAATGRLISHRDLVLDRTDQRLSPNSSPGMSYSQVMKDR
jgi:hypothetical protein